MCDILMRERSCDITAVTGAAGRAFSFDRQPTAVLYRSWPDLTLFLLPLLLPPPPHSTPLRCEDGLSTSIYPFSLLSCSVQSSSSPPSLIISQSTTLLICPRRNSTPHVTTQDGTPLGTGKQNVFRAYCTKPGRQTPSLSGGRVFRMAAEK